MISIYEQINDLAHMSVDNADFRNFLIAECSTS